MEFNCSDNDISYRVNPTDSSKLPFIVPGFSMDKDTMDITLVGKSRLEYGKQFNENILHLLERFASPSEIANVPDSSSTFNERLVKPQIGQLWFNNHYDVMNVCIDNNPPLWTKLINSGHISGNCGFLFDGEDIPLPVDHKGVVFDVDECFWIVTPAFINSQAYGVDTFSVSASERTVSAEAVTNFGNTVKCFAYYTIIGIRKYND